MTTNWLCEHGARIGREQSGTGNRVGPRVSRNERLPSAVVFARERLLRKTDDQPDSIVQGIENMVHSYIEKMQLKSLVKWIQQVSLKIHIQFSYMLLSKKDSSSILLKSK